MYFWKKLKISCALTIFFILSCCFVSAEENEEKAFSGFFLVGGIYSNGEMSLDDTSEDKNKKIDSLSDSSEDYSLVSPFFMGNLTYNINSTGTSIGIGSDLDGFGLTLSQYGGDLGYFTLKGSMGKDEVFKDPYLVGVKRDKTDAETKSFSLSWDDILGSSVSAEYSFLGIDVEDDKSGKKNKKLQRDGNIHSFGVNFELFDIGMHKISTGIAYEIGDIKGKSNAFKGVGGEIAYLIEGEGWEVETELSFLSYDYDESHPVFKKTRQDKEGLISTTFTLYEPFQLENWFVQSLVAYSKSDSNIDFYDSSSVSTFFGVGYNF